MASIPYMPLFVEPFLTDTDHLTDAELGLYTRMLVKLWMAPDRRFPNDIHWLARRFRRSVEEADTTIMPLVREFFRTNGNWIWSARLSKEFDRVAASMAKQSARAKARHQNGETSPNPSRAGSRAGATRGRNESDRDKPLNDNEFDACRGSAGPAVPSTSTLILKKETPIGVYKERPQAQPATSPDGEADTFSEWYARYPRKVGRKKAETAYRTAAARASPEEILDGLGRAIADWTARGSFPEFVPHPATWLHRDGWADEHYAQTKPKDPFYAAMHNIEQEMRNAEINNATVLDGTCDGVPEEIEGGRELVAQNRGHSNGHDYGISRGTEALPSRGGNGWMPPVEPPETKLAFPVRDPRVH